ncbi:MAG TPA: hypothetical protein VMU21_12205 [Thermodesulfovibrionales bacterium]|nr:hypothetical protein [Thermodesulfovibrionales bacterium]
MNKTMNASAETGQFIVLDLFNPDIVNVECNEKGETLYFDTEEKAMEHAEDVQDPLVIELSLGGANVVRSTHVLLNVVLFPENEQSDDIPSGKENHIYLNGKYISSRCNDEYDDYTVTWEGYCGILNGLKMAIPGLTCKDILIDDVRLTEILGENWREYYEEGSLWARVERQLGVQVIE